MSLLRPQPPRPPHAAAPGSGLEERLAAVGARLRSSFAEIVAELPEGDAGPLRLGRSLGLDKVLASRLLKALRAKDPLAFLHHAPGPDPLRRVLRAARRAGVGREAVEAGFAAVDGFEELIRREAGDRAALDAMLSSWLPQARASFELRRKQAAHRALAELKGVKVETQLSTVFLHPSADGQSIDVVWVFGLFGLRRLRPDAAVKLASRRMAGGRAERRPRTLAGDAVDAEDVAGLRLDAFCQEAPAALAVERHGEVVHYVLAGEGFGPRSAVDLVLAEANLAEMPRFVPEGSGRKGYVFAEVAPPTRRLVFDCLVHEDVYPGADPALVLYDTALEGVADVNDRARDLDRLDLTESVRSLGMGTGPIRSAHVPGLGALVQHVLDSMGWDGARFRSYRVVLEYPLYGSQVCLAFDPPETPR